MQWLDIERFPLWEAWGADRRTLLETCSRIGSLLDDTDLLSGWTFEFMQDAMRMRDEARAPAPANMKGMLYRKASVYFGIATYPMINTPLKEEAYARQREMSAAGRQFLPYLVEDVRIPFMGKEIVGHFAKPRLSGEIVLPEAVLLTGGAQMAKEDLETVVSKIAECGMACLSIDMPGTGESAWKLSADADDVYLKAVKYLAARGDVDANRIGAFGIGLGGYWALLLAAIAPEVKAVVNVGGPVHASFGKEHVERYPDRLKKVLAHVQGYNPDKTDDVEKALDNMGQYSLVKRNRIRSIDCPVVSIDGRDDPYVPIDDLFAISSECGIKQDEWVYDGDTHCAPKHFNEWMPRAVIWMANRIGGPERIASPDLARL
jgi:esterase/lipase